MERDATRKAEAALALATTVRRAGRAAVEIAPPRCSHHAGGDALGGTCGLPAAGVVAFSPRSMIDARPGSRRQTGARRDVTLGCEMLPTSHDEQRCAPGARTRRTGRHAERLARGSAAHVAHTQVRVQGPKPWRPSNLQTSRSEVQS
jgi:hypothetical protein